MKAFNIVSVVLALFAGGLLLSSCEDEVMDYNEYDTTKLESQETIIPPTQGEYVSESSINLAELDSMKNNIENLKEQVRESADRTDKNENEIFNLKEQEADIKLYLLISFAIVIISLAIAIVALFKAARFSKILEIYGNDIDDLKQSSNSRCESVSRQNGACNSVPRDYGTLKSRVARIEEQVKALNKLKNTDYNRVSPYTPNPTPTPVPVVEAQKGYFGQPTQADRGYFRSFLTVRDSEARFSAEEANNVAKFEPLLNTHAELETLLHTDAAKLAVDFEGCSPQDATTATVKKPGIAKFEGNRWYITQKAQVALTRQ